jgi:uncharacterized protein (TIGR04255 family)
MAERIHYSKAPITEAVIDLRITSSPGFSVEDLAPLREVVAERYPNQESEHVFFEQISLVETDLLRTGGGHQLNGFRFASQDKRETFYARLDGFAFSIKAPYDRWESFRDEARGLWDLYCSVAGIESVTRVAIRYINRIDVPGAASIKLEDYLRTYPEVSADWPEEGLMSNFFMQMQLWQEDLGCWLVVNEAPDMPPAEGVMSIRLDFDLFREQFEDPWRTDDDEAVWEFLERLHDRKNEIFEATITETTRRLIR